MKYWNENKDRLPQFAKATRKYLSAPPTSVDSEHLFIAVSHVDDEKRNRIVCDDAVLSISASLSHTHTHFSLITSPSLPSIS